MTDVSIALPLWRSSRIVWLILESLCRQETGARWELLVSECGAPAAWGILKEYRERLQAAGCQRISYSHSVERRLLGLKWREIALRSAGEAVLLCAADNYEPPDRIERARELILEEGYDWADTSCGLFYNIRTGETGTWRRPAETATGLWMACRAEHLRRLTGVPPRKGIDGWIKGQLPEGFRWHQGSEARMGLHTDGANTISMQRATKYGRTCLAPFHPPTQTVREILPPEVLARLTHMQVQVCDSALP